MTFTHRFKHRLTCTVTVTEAPPAPGQSHVQACQWDPFPTPRQARKLLPEYVRWLHVVNQTCADQWKLKILYGIQTGPRSWQFWRYEPGVAPRLERALTE